MRERKVFCAVEIALVFVLWFLLEQLPNNNTLLENIFGSVLIVAVVGAILNSSEWK